MATVPEILALPGVDEGDQAQRSCSKTDSLPPKKCEGDSPLGMTWIYHNSKSSVEFLRELQLGPGKGFTQTQPGLAQQS